MIQFLEDSLKEIQKNTEKKMIHLFTASQANATSGNRKLLIKEQKKNSVANLESKCENYLDKFATSAKGKWVKKAQEAFKSIDKDFDNI